MAKHGRGLICLALTRERCEQLGLPLMAQGNESRLSTAFTVSIEAREGVTTGISAADRARTVAVAIDPAKGRDDIVSPGHVFPLMARDGGVLVRAGHTEAAVDIARLAGLKPAGVICEIMNDDGTMARLPDLVGFAQRHGLKVGTIADLIAYRLRNDRLVERDVATTFHSRFGGDFRLQVYANVLGRGGARGAGRRATSPRPSRSSSACTRSTCWRTCSGMGESGRGDQLHRGDGGDRRRRAAASSSCCASRRRRDRAPRQGDPRLPAGAAARPPGLRHRRADPARPRREGHDPALERRPPIVGLEGYGLSVVETRPIPPGKG